MIAYESRNNENCSTKKSVSDVYSLIKTIYSMTNRRKKNNPMMKTEFFFLTNDWCYRWQA
ncbi:hypothetical protein DPMN_191344 [Dreissena polymorpha]|uniref:Uncharacterized protein n=1 Tax=Dreissena polymorpha TaxID=45954 RepID=A0A9D3Y180_DREPO|nr:hypothetical protein DPMN_191344 [Dreissena polymorpha]